MVARLSLNGVIIVAALSISVNCEPATQAPLVVGQKADADYYRFKWPIRNVAVIGAGPGGIISYRELTQAGFNVHLFERDNMPGGNWHYTEEVPDRAAIPNAEISIADFVPSLPPEGVQLPFEQYYSEEEAKELLRAHRGPKPVWASLHSNAPAPAQQITEFPWPSGTSWDLPHEMLARYLRSFASYHGVNSNDDNSRVFYNTRVELIEKRFNEKGEEAGWTLTLKELKHAAEHSAKAVWTKQDFDAVVVATGRYNAPNIPGIPGLPDWAKRFPDRIIHSRQYRHPQPYSNQTVVVVGSSASAVEIARELERYAKKVYLSIRAHKEKTPWHYSLLRLPKTVERVPEIKRFLSPTSDGTSIELEFLNGTTLKGVDSMVFGTGFLYSFPFLPQYHNSSIRLNEIGPRDRPQPIVTDGTHLRNLYLDVFSIEEPTLGFVDMNIGMQSFTYAEYIAVALSMVWSNRAKIPSTPDLWRWNQKHLQEIGGYSKYYQFLGVRRTDEMIRFFTGWLNDAAAKYGGRQVRGVDPEYSQIVKYWSLALFGSDPESEPGEEDTKSSSTVPECIFNKKAFQVQCGNSVIDTEDVINNYW